ncbi:hypothetical protein Tco_0670824 [Tanacetum coccineum]
MGSAIVKLVKKVKKLEGLVTPSKTTVNASGEEQVEYISPTTLEAAKTLSRVASQKPKSIDKGRRYKRRKKSKGKKVVTSLDFQEDVSTGYAEGVNTGSTKFSTVSGQEVNLPQGEDFAKKMVELVNQRKKHFAEERAEQKEIAHDPIQMKNIYDELLDESRDMEDFTRWTRKRRKQIARKGLHFDKTDEDESEASKDADPISGTDIPIHPVGVAIKPPSIATYKIIKQGEKGVYQIVREDETDIVYINFGAMLKDITRDDLTELYRIVMNRYGMNRPEDEFEKILWEYLKNMFEPPLSTDPIWSLLDKKLQGGKPDEDCYKMLKMMEKQAGIRK